jgi:hypothetical protein
VEIGAAPAERQNGSLVLWLRWDLAGGSRDFGVEWKVERTELDCAAGRARVLFSRRIQLDARAKVQSDSVIVGSPTTWRTYATGSLGAQVVNAACRQAGAGA